MGEFSHDQNDLFIEVADLSNEEGFIKFPVYQSSYFIRDDGEAIIPLTAYYFEALKLCILPYTNSERFDKLLDCFNKLWFACDKVNVNSINEFVKKNSDYLRRLIQNSDKTGKGIYVSLFDNPNYDNFDNILGFYNVWVKTGNNQKIVDDFENQNGSCVAIAMPLFFDSMDGSNCYMSLSGTRKDYLGSLPGLVIDPNLLATYTAINDFLQFVFGFRFIECHLNDDTKRYTHYSTKSEVASKDYKGRVLANPVNFSTDYKKYYSSDPKTLSRHFSCCEKKIIRYMNFVNTDYKKLSSHKKVVNKLTSYEFRIKMKPCRMCRPALIGCYFIGYGYFSFNDYIFGPCKTNQISLNPVSNKKEPLIVV